MKPRRFLFADEYEHRPPPPSVWLTRSIITGLMAGVASTLYLFGYLHF